MNIPPYWSKATHPADQGQEVGAWGWSFASLEDATQQAAVRAKRIWDTLTSGRKPDRYGYADRPMREEIIDQLREGDETIAMVTRNRYGALVLNSARVLFADVDFPPLRPAGFREWLAFLFIPGRRERARRTLAESTSKRIERWAGANPSRSFRLYRTKQGLRLLFTDRLYDPTATETRTTLDELGSDPLYMTLTEKQECFRARLTAKPWRCGCSCPPNSYPWQDEIAEQAYRRWERRYTEDEAEFRACELVEEFGHMADIQTVRTIVAAHDKLARVETTAPLA